MFKGSIITPVHHTLLGLLWLPTQVQAQSYTEPSSWLWIGTSLLVAQSVVIALLWRSKVKHQQLQIDLTRNQRNLEMRMAERTEKLRTINNKLYDEIAKHEFTEDLLQQTKDYLNSIINSMPSILIGVTRQGYVTHWNTAAQHATEIEEKHALGQHIHQVYPQLPVKLELITQAIEQGIPQVSENIQHGEGSLAQYCDATVYPLLSSEISGAVIRVDDVTMRVRIENMMIQNEKMMSLGELAAGMAHEINNPLSAIINSVQNIQRRSNAQLTKNVETAESLGINMEALAQYHKQREISQFLDSIRDAASRAAKIVTNMLEFSRSNSRGHSAFDLEELIEHCLILARNSLELSLPDGSEEPKIIRDYEQGLPAVTGSAAEIQQVVLNLLRNASQSFSHLDCAPPTEPTITLRLKQEKEELVLNIEDNGPGMSENVRRHIFEPFFTTKEIGKGTGLGLSVSYFIITEHHDGTIEVDSAPGRGTRFCIRLPINTEQQLPLTIG